MRARFPSPAGAPVPQLETARLVLRAWTPDDAGAYSRIVGDPEVMRHIGAGLRYRIKRIAAGLIGRVSDIEARRGVAQLIRHWNEWGYGEWAVQEKRSGELVGQVGLVHHPDWIADPAKVEIGWMLCRSAWGRGIAAEAAVASLTYAFGDLGLARVVSIARPDNERSLRVMQRIGLARVGRTYWKGGEVIWYAADRESWVQVSR